MKIVTGDLVTEELYLKTWQLNNETFHGKNQFTKEKALEWFYASNKSIIICCDDQEEIVYGFLFPFLLKHNFASRYIKNTAKFKSITKKDFLAKPKGNGDLYLFRTVIQEEYRNKDISELGKPIFQALNEKLLDWVCMQKQKGTSFYYVFAERMSEDGEKYLKSMKLAPCFAVSGDVKYAILFSTNLFSKCDNAKKIWSLYNKNSVRNSLSPLHLKGHQFLKIEKGNLFYKDIKLIDLAKKYGSPLEVAYTEMIDEQVIKMKEMFAKAIKKNDYLGSYKFAYATKANYYSEVVLSALKSCDCLETSSSYDIGIISRLAKDNYIKPPFTIICNGFKNEKYIQNIKELLDLGIDVIPVIENEKELDLLLKLNQPMNVGIRYNSDFEDRLINDEFQKRDEFDNRFGFDKTELEAIVKKICKSKNLIFKMLHFHFGGTISNTENFLKGYSNIFALYCNLKKKYNSLNYFDFGGGFPVKFSLTYEFNYKKLVNGIVSTSKKLSDKFQIEAPTLIGEHGRYTVADHSFYIYKIDFTKKSNDKWWYIINGSMMNMAPDVWGLGQNFTILPINLLNHKCIPVRLGGETCDPDDRYFVQEKNKELFLPTIKKNETLYIAIFSIGAYQEMLSGIGGVHHCMIPEGNELVIYRDKQTNQLKELKVGEIQSVSEMLSVLSYDDKNYMDKF